MSEQFVHGLSEYAGLPPQRGEALDMLDWFRHISHDRRAYEHPVRMHALAEDFIGDAVNPLFYDALLLHDLADRVERPEMKKNAKAALRGYAATVDEPSLMYVEALLADLSDVEATAEATREIELDDHLLQGILRETVDRNKPVAKRYWMMPAGVVHPEKMLELLERTNIESLLIKSIESLDNLQNPSSKEISVFQDVFEAEAFYAPLCEVLGFDGLAMALRDQAARIRLIRSGNIDLIDQAEELIAGLGPQNVMLREMNALLDRIGGDSDFAAVVGNQSRHGINIGELLHSMTIEDEKGTRETVLRGVWRVKSLGSLAFKLYDEARPPMDLIGLTVICPDERSVAEYFGSITARLAQVDTVTFMPANSRNESLHVRGDDDYRQLVMGSLAINQLVDEKKTGQSDFRVSKVTFINQQSNGIEHVPVRYEIQVMTEVDRVNARVGTPAHLFFKLEEQRKRIERNRKSGDETEVVPIVFDDTVLRRIRERKRHMGKAAVNPASQAKAREFHQLYAA